MYSIKEASELSGVKVRTIRSWIKSGFLKAKKNARSRFWFIKDEDLQKIMEGRKMNVRNFYLETNIDGYKSKVKGGPRSKNGGK